MFTPRRVSREMRSYRISLMQTHYTSLTLCRRILQSPISLPFFDRFGSVHAARLKQQGRRFPLFIFEILTSTRRLRVSGFWVALTQRTHSQRAIGVIPFHRSWIF